MGGSSGTRTPCKSTRAGWREHNPRDATAAAPPSQESISWGPCAVKDSQPGHCPAHMLSLPHVPLPKAPKPGEDAAPPSGEIPPSLCQRQGAGCPGTPCFSTIRDTVTCQTHTCSAHLAPGMPRSPVREVVPVEIIVQVTVTAAGGGERTCQLLCGSTDTMEQSLLGIAPTQPSSLGSRRHPGGSHSSCSTIQEVALPWKGSSSGVSESVEWDGESPWGDRKSVV